MPEKITLSNGLKDHSRPRVTRLKPLCEEPQRAIKATVRFFSLKFGNKKVFGSVIKTDLVMDGPTRAKIDSGQGTALDFIGSDARESFYYRMRDETVYIPRDESPSVLDACVSDSVDYLPIGDNKRTGIVLKVDADGLVSLHRKPKNRNVFLSEVDQNKASELKSGEKNWRLLQSWV